MTLRYAPYLFLAFNLAACDRTKAYDTEESPVSSEATVPQKMITNGATASADFEAAKGQEVEGKLKFEPSPQGVRVTGKIEASPGPHGFHVHEKGDCSDIPGKSMGGHFAPEGHIHALPDETNERHLGDLGNVVTDANSMATVDFVIVGANLNKGDRHSLLGKAVVLHSGEDTGKAHQPAGDSGVPIACGVITSS